MKKILIIDDSAVMRNLLLDYLADLKFDVDACGDAEEGISKAVTGDYDLCICDMHMPKASGLDVLRQVREARPELQFVFTDSLPDQLSEKVQKLGTFQYLHKPFELEQLRKIIVGLLKPVRTQ
ncbi:MAG: response regulator [Candidatus Zixiibacteriota bacterium]|nr:MAG: response regulator [candidate division Zixibacteria bacterium]